MARVVLAMSGGVDSSVAAHLLLEAGHEVIGVFMRHGQMARPEPPCDVGSASGLPILNGSPTHRQGCCSAADALDARRVADRLEIPFYALNMDQGFERITDYFVQQYLSGRTPNPCVVCNHWLKFGLLFDYADSVQADYVATGHYARLLQDTDGWGLWRGRDVRKDQSYVLFGIARERFARMLLPVGDFEKPAIRQLARKLQLRVAEKRDSQEICFVERGRHADFVASRRSEGAAHGELVTTDGRVVGEHTGIERFTVGQRKGLGVALGQPMYVVRIDPESRRVVLGSRDELLRRSLTADNCNWLVTPREKSFSCEVQIRYQSRPVPAIVSTDDLGVMRVEFCEPCWGVAPGQAAVCYDGDRVLGGGWIRDAAA